MIILFYPNATAKNFDRLKRGFKPSNSLAKEIARSLIAARLLGALLNEKFNSFAIMVKCFVVILFFVCYCLKILN